MSQQTITGNRDQVRLYDLIWKRTIASQMANASLERTNVKIDVLASEKVDETFTARGEMIKFDGFLKVYLEGSDMEDEEQDGMLPNMQNGDPLENIYVTATERFTRPPYRYTEASLVKQLEELGIGRPSTYAPTRSEEHTSELQSRPHLVCRLLLEKKKKKKHNNQEKKKKHQPQRTNKNNHQR